MEVCMVLHTEIFPPTLYLFQQSNLSLCDIQFYGFLKITPNLFVLFNHNRYSLVTHTPGAFPVLVLALFGLHS